MKDYAIEQKDVTMGAFKLLLDVDDDGHLNILIESLDGSPVLDTAYGEIEPDEPYRFTTRKIEDADAEVEG